MKLIDLLGPMDPKIVVNVFVDVKKDKYEYDNVCLFEGMAGSVPVLLTKLKVTHIGLSSDMTTDDDTPTTVLTVDGIFTNEDDSNHYKTIMG